MTAGGQVELRVQCDNRVVAGKLKSGGNLAIPHLPRGTGVLARDANRMLAPPGKAGVVDQKETVLPELLAEVPGGCRPHTTGVPRAPIHGLLEKIRGITLPTLDLTNATGERFDALALTVDEEANQERSAARRGRR